MAEMTRREGTIKYVLSNLYYRWPILKSVDANKLAECYENFSLSDDFGDNDEKFPEWFKHLLKE